MHVGPWFWKKAKIKEEKKGWCEVRESELLDKEIEDDRSARKMDHGQLNKQKKPPLDALEHRMRRKERHVGEALQIWVKLT